MRNVAPKATQVTHAKNGMRKMKMKRRNRT